MRRFLIFLLLLSTQAPAQEAEPLQCTDIDTYSQLDFWVGEWDVYSGEVRQLIEVSDRKSVV